MRSALPRSFLLLTHSQILALFINHNLSSYLLLQFSLTVKQNKCSTNNDRY